MKDCFVNLKINFHRGKCPCPLYQTGSIANAPQPKIEMLRKLVLMFLAGDLSISSIQIFENLLEIQVVA